MNSFSVLKRILTYSKTYLAFLVGGIVSAIIGVGISLLIPIWVGNAIDYVIGPNQVDFPSISPLLLRIGVAIGLSAFFQWLMNYCMNQVTFQTVQDLRVAAFEKIGKVPLKYIDNHTHGNLINTIINDIEQISDGLLQGFMQLFTGIMTILGTLILMLSINITIALIVVFLTPLSIFMASFIAKRISSKFKKQSEIRGELSGYIKEMLSQQKIVRAFGYEQRAINHFSDINSRLKEVGRLAQFYSALTNPCTRFVNSVIYTIVGIVGALSVIQGRFSVGMLSSFLTYANQYTKPFNEISGVITELQAAFASARRVFAMIDAPIESSDADLKTDVTVNGHVKFEQVSFCYRPSVPLIEDLNLDVKPGQTIAIVGPTGSGKSTLINLLMRFYDVNSGKIYISDENITMMKRQTLRDMFGMVLQETWLFNGSIRANIAYGKPEATEEEIQGAAKAAYAHSFITRLPEGYDTIIAEDGGNLSQGERQLLAIARVMLTQPPMLILDEATSNIDTLTEQRVQKAFAKLMLGKTSFIVAHRLSTIKEADVILVLKDGQIVEQGSHEELLEKGEFYANLYNSQFATQ